MLLLCVIILGIIFVIIIFIIIIIVVIIITIVVIAIISTITVMVTMENDILRLEIVVQQVFHERLAVLVIDFNPKRYPSTATIAFVVRGGVSVVVADVADFALFPLTPRVPNPVRHQQKRPEHKVHDWRCQLHP